MNSNTPQLDLRDLEKIVEDMLRHIPAYVPNWKPKDQGSGQALLQIYARYLKALSERVNQAPDKHRLAFFDLLGINLLPAQAARAPLVFEPYPSVGDSYVPERARASAQLPNSAEPIVFETEKSIVLTTAQLVEAVSVWPTADAYADHTEDLRGECTFTLFDTKQIIPHELYLAHHINLALSGSSIVKIRFELTIPASEKLDLQWGYWDGEVWRSFAPFEETDSGDNNKSFDGTAGLTRSGVVRLASACAEAPKKRVNGIESYWLRVRIATPLINKPGLILPEIERIHIWTEMHKKLWSIFQHNQAIESSADKLKISGTIQNSNGASIDVIPFFYGNKGEWAVTNNGSFTWEAMQFSVYEILVVGNLPLKVGEISTDNRTMLLDIILEDGAKIDFVHIDNQQQDISKPFLLFGLFSLPGSTCYIASEETFRKKNATLYMYFHLKNLAFLDIIPGTAITFEYWNGKQWYEFFRLSGNQWQSSNNIIEPPGFNIPSDAATTIVDGRTGWWIRLVIISGGFLLKGTTLPTGLMVENFRLGYSYQSREETLEHCLTCNDFQWSDRSEAARWQGNSFKAFSPSIDLTPALYLGFNKTLPPGLISIYFDINEDKKSEKCRLLKWEYWSNNAWRSLSVEDETEGLTIPGMVACLWPGKISPDPYMVLYAEGIQVQLLDPRVAPRFRKNDLIYISQQDQGELATVAAVENGKIFLAYPLGKSYLQANVELAGLARFGKPCTWIRARLQDNIEPSVSKVNGIKPNAVWAIQAGTFKNEVIGSGTDQPDQICFIRNIPVLEGEIVEVRELEGARAQIELPMLKDELKKQRIVNDSITIVRDQKNRDISEVWVRWQQHSNLFFSGPSDRHYMIERSQGRVIFGDGVHGKPPPAGRNNIRVLKYHSGGGSDGNVKCGAISQNLSGAMAQSVSNPRDAEGGADNESITNVYVRAPQVVKHHYQALSLSDYEALACEASPAIAVARALPTHHPSGRHAGGWVKLIIMPHSKESQPQPSSELIRQVERYLAARIPVAVVGQLSISGPKYLPVGVNVVAVPNNFSQGRNVFIAIEAAIKRFLHPLTGGAEGNGWPFGRDVFLSDIAAILEAIPGVNFIETINLLLDGTPKGETVEIPEDRIVVAGPININLAGGHA